MKIRFLKAKSWLIAAAAGLLGINVSCEPEPDMYGTPVGTFRISGKVTNPQGEPIEGIGVGNIYRYGDNEESVRFADTTGPDGQYALSTNGVAGATVELKFHDIDDSQHGHYRDQEVAVSASSSDFHGGDGNWNQGTADITKDVVMQPAE